MSLAILHVITSLELGGAETMLLKLSKQLQGRQDQKILTAVLVLKNSKTGLTQQFLDIGIQVLNLEITSPRCLVHLFRLKRQLGFEPDIVQGWLPHGNILSLLLQKLFFPKARLFWNVRQSLHTWGTGSSITRLLIRLGGKLSSLPDKIFFNSQTGAQQHYQIGYHSAKGVVIPNGFEIETLGAAGAKRGAYRKQLALEDDTIAIIHVARFDPTKDHETFLKATIPLLKNNPFLKVICVGKNVTIDNPEISKHIPLELRKRFLLLDERRDVPELLAASDIYCSSSRAEAFSNSIGEAMCASLPCVVTDVGDSRYILQNDDFVVAPENEDLLRQALAKACQLTSEQRQILGQRSFSRVQDHFSIQSVSASFLLQWGSMK